MYAYPTHACLTIRQVRTPSAASLPVFVSVTSQFWPLASSDEQGSLAREHHLWSIRVASLYWPYLLQRLLGPLRSTAHRARQLVLRSPVMPRVVDDGLA